MLLELEGVERGFGGVRAADGVSFGVAAGTVHGLIGPNGAGKTTVLNLISGLLRAQRGAIHFDGRRIERLQPYQIAGLGIRRTFQSVRLYAGMTALENVTAGQHLLRHSSLAARLCCLPSARREERRLAAEAQRTLLRVGIDAPGDTPGAALALGDQRRLEIARALASHPRLLLLDEPAAGLNAVEAAALGELLRALVAEGLTVLLVEHNVRLVMSVCDTISVLNFGRVIAGGTPAEVVADRAVVEAYLGSDDDGAGNDGTADEVVADLVIRSQLGPSG